MKYHLSYRFHNVERKEIYNTLFEFYQRLEELQINEQVLDHSIRFCTHDNIVVNPFPAYEPTQKELATEKEYIEFKGGKK